MHTILEFFVVQFEREDTWPSWKRELSNLHMLKNVVRFFSFFETPVRVHWCTRARTQHTRLQNLMVRVPLSVAFLYHTKTHTHTHSHTHTRARAHTHTHIYLFRRFFKKKLLLKKKSMTTKRFCKTILYPPPPPGAPLSLSLSRWPSGPLHYTALLRHYWGAFKALLRLCEGSITLAIRPIGAQRRQRGAAAEASERRWWWNRWQHARASLVCVCVLCVCVCVCARRGTWPGNGYWWADEKCCR